MNKVKILSLIPIIILFLLLVKFHPALPFWDEWELVPLVDKLYQQQLSFSDLVAPHNEHIPFFPRIIMLTLIYLTKWNVLIILLFNILFTVFSYTILNRITKAFLGGLKLKNHPLLYVVNSLVIFSLTQWENWLWGWQMEIFLSVSAILTGLLFWTKFNWKIKNFLILILLGVISSFSFATGIVYWLIGLFNLILFYKKDPEKKFKTGFILVWMLLSATVLYFPPHKISGFDFRVFPYLGSYLGSPLLSFNPFGAMVFGFIGFILFSYLLIQTFRQKDKNFFTLLPVINLGLFAIGSGILTSLGRSNLGILQAISSRYTTISNFYWISIIYLLIYWQQVKLYGKHQNNVLSNKSLVLLIKFLSRRACRSSPYCCAGLNVTSTGYLTRVTRLLDGNSNLLSKRSNLLIYTIISFLAINSFLRIFKFPKQYQYLSEAKEALISGQNEVFLQRLYYSEEVVRERSEILKKYHLAIYRD